jgi:hypothetical protein
VGEGRETPGNAKVAKKDLTPRLSAAEPQPNAGIADIADIAGI